MQTQGYSVASLTTARVHRRWASMVADAASLLGLKLASTLEPSSR